MADEADKFSGGEGSFAPIRRCRLRLWHIVVGVLCLAVAAVLLMRWHWRVEFQQRIEAIRAAAALEWALNAVAFPPEQLARLDRGFGRVHADDALLRAIAGDRCLFLKIFEEPQILSREGRYPKPPAAGLLGIYGAVGLAAREGTMFLDYMEECLQIARLPTSRRPAAIKAREARYARARKGLLWKEVDARDLPAMMQSRLDHVALLEMAKTLLVVERYRLVHVSLPETLDQLVPGYLAAVPPDPFDGAPLRYKRIGRGFVVYSVGQDGRDDGGRQKPLKTSKESGETWDLVFRVESP